MALEMIGHKWAVDLLTRHLAEREVRHAYLFTGPDGVGKRTLALQFTQALLCEAPPASGEVCGRCRVCRLVPSQSHPDLHVLEAGQVGGTLEVGQVREQQRMLALAPFEASRRVSLLLRFHEASQSAANALLKTLEEPPPQVILLLTARSVDSVLPTVASRCEILRLRSLPISDLEEALIRRAVPRDEARLLARLTGGRPGRALRWAESPAVLARREELLSDLLSLLSGTRSERFAYVDQLTKGNEEPQVKRRRCTEALEVWMGWWRDVMLRSFRAQAVSLHPDRASELERIASAVDAASALGAVQAIERTRIAIAKNANLRLAMEILMLDLPQV